MSLACFEFLKVLRARKSGKLLGKSCFRTNLGILYPAGCAVKRNNVKKTFLQEDSDGYILPGYESWTAFWARLLPFLPPHAPNQKQHY